MHGRRNHIRKLAIAFLEQQDVVGLDEFVDAFGYRSWGLQRGAGQVPRGWGKVGLGIISLSAAACQATSRCRRGLCRFAPASGLLAAAGRRRPQPGRGRVPAAASHRAPGGRACAMMLQVVQAIGAAGQGLQGLVGAGRPGAGRRRQYRAGWIRWHRSRLPSLQPVSVPELHRQARRVALACATARASWLASTASTWASGAVAAGPAGRGGAARCQIHRAGRVGGTRNFQPSPPGFRCRGGGRARAHPPADPARRGLGAGGWATGVPPGGAAQRLNRRGGARVSVSW